jgi:hypothetical protein
MCVRFTCTSTCLEKRRGDSQETFQRGMMPAVWGAAEFAAMFRPRSG